MYVGTRPIFHCKQIKSEIISYKSDCQRKMRLSCLFFFDFVVILLFDETDAIVVVYFSTQAFPLFYNGFELFRRNSAKFHLLNRLNSAV